MNKITMFSREQETKKVFFQLGKKFHLPLDIIIIVYNSLRKSVDYDRSLQIKYHKNILSAHLCGPPYSIFDIDDEFFNTQNPFQYRLPIGKGNEWLIESDDARKENLFYHGLPIGKGNEWLIESDDARKENLFYHGLYSELKPKDIINKQIEIYGEINFILKYQVVRGRELYEPLTGMERIKFIDRIGIDLFDLYFEYLEESDYNIVRMGYSYKDIWMHDEQ